MSPPPITLWGMTTSPCTWPVARSCLPDNANPALVAEAVDTAVGVLWALTGRRFGTCPVEARPCPPGTPPSGIPLSPGPGWVPLLDAGTIRNAPACTTTACDRTGAIILPGPVHKLLGMSVDGDDVDLTTVVLHGDRIMRRDGLPWPAQHLDRPEGDPGTWSIRYLRGTPPPAGAAHAVGTLAKEFLAACTTGKCALPRRTTQVQRQGVTVSMVDPQDIFDSGATGLPEVDLWIRAWNPNRMQQPAAVWSPDQAVW